MLTDRLKALMRTQGGTAAPPATAALAGERLPAPEDYHPRHSNGLEQFFSYIRGESGLMLLDLGGLNQDNVSFITSLGHKLYSEDFLTNLRLCGDDGDLLLRDNLNYPEEFFNGVLVWDVLEHLDPLVLKAVIERLQHCVKPRSYLFAICHAQEKAERVPLYSFRIRDSKTLLMAERGERKPKQLFNNRSLEKLFQGFESLKFFLTRDKLRELIIKR